MGIIMTNNNVVEFTATIGFDDVKSSILRHNMLMKAANMIKAKMAEEGCIPCSWWYATIDNPYFKGSFYKYYERESSHACGREPELILISTVKVLNIGGHHIMVSHKWDQVVPKDDKVLLMEKNGYRFWELKSPIIKDSKFLLSKTGGGFFD